MTKIVILVEEFTNPAQLDLLQEQLEMSGVGSLLYHKDLAAFEGDYDGDLEPIKALRHVENAADKVTFKL